MRLNAQLNGLVVLQNKIFVFQKNVLLDLLLLRHSMLTCNALFYIHLYLHN